MNFSTTPRWLMPMLVGMLAIFSTSKTSAQCTLDPIPPNPTPTPITIYVNAGGVASLNASVIYSYFQSNCPFFSTRFYSQAAGGADFGDFINYSCSDVGAPPFSVWVTARPGAGYPDPNESLRRQVVITVVDNLPPSIPAIANASVGTNPSTACSAAVAGIDAAPTDNCPIAKLTWVSTGATSAASPLTGINQASGTVFNVGVSTVTYTATDPSGNTATRSFTVTVTDDDPPVVTCPGGPYAPGMTMGACSYTYLSSDPKATAVDNCAASGSLVFDYDLTGATTVSNLTTLSGQVFQPGMTTVTVTASGGTPNLTSASCMFVVNITDNQDPVVGTVPSNITISTSTGTSTPMDLCDGQYSWMHPSPSDNCLVSSQTISIGGGPAGAFVSGAAIGPVVFPLGSTTILYTVTDNSGRTKTASFVVTVVDDVDPVVVFNPADGSGTSATTSSYTAPANNCFANVTIEQPNFAVTDPVYCGGIPAPTPCANFTMTDCGAVTITRLPNPVIDGFVPAFNPLDPLNRNLTANFPVGVGVTATLIQYHVTDNAGNTTTITIEVNVTELTPPFAGCVVSKTVALGPNGTITIAPSELNDNSFDNCGNVSFSASPTTFTCADLVPPAAGPIPTTLFVEDLSGNVSTCVVNVMVVDNVPPQVLCPLPIIVNTGVGVCTATAVAGANLSAGTIGSLNPGQWADNCPGTVITWNVTGATTLSGAGAGTLSAQVFAKGVNNVVYTLDDPSNPPVNCNFTITVVDNQAPVPQNCPPNLTVNANIAPGCSYKKSNSNPCIVDVNNPANQWCGTVNFMDNCGGASMVSDLASLSQTYALGTNPPIVVTRTDASGNVGTCSFSITVVDQTPPTAICKNLTTQLNAGGTATVTALQVNNGSFDNCYFDLIYEIKRPSGAMFGPSVTYNCSDIGVKTIEFRVKEDAVGGLISPVVTCSITVQDLVQPLCVAKNLTVNLSATNPGTVTVNAAALNNGSSDNCTAAGALTFKMSELPTGPFTSTLTFDCTPLGANTVYLQVSDASGNTNDPSNILTPCSSIVTVQDITNPAVVSTPGNITVSCNTVGSDVTAYVASLADATFSDNCSVVNIIETFGITPGTCPDGFVINRSWIATDAAGLTVQAVQTIIVQDVIKPSIGNLANVTLNLSNYMTCTPTVSYSATVSDNCSTPAFLAANTTWVIDYPGVTPPNTVGTGLTATPVGGFRLGVNVITFTTTDACMNTQSASMTVTVVDNVPPVFSSYNVPTTLDSYCNHAPFVFSNTPNTCGYTFNWVRPWNGDITDCSSFTFAPENIVAVTQVGGMPVTQTLSANFPWDPTNSLTEFVPVAINLPVGVTTFTYKATDAAANTTTCSFTVQVNDVQAPSITCPANLTLNTICPTSPVPDFRNLVNISDNCLTGVVVTQSKMGVLLGNTATIAYLPGPPNPPTHGSTFQITFTATDGTNAATPCVTTVTLNDTDAPIPTSGSLAGIVSNCGYAIVSAPTAFPNCGLVPLIYGTPGGVSATPFEVVGVNVVKYKVTGTGNFFITWSYNDGNGNTTTQLQQLTINADVAPPVAKCKLTQTVISLSASFPATASITPQQIDADNGSFSVNGSHDPDFCTLPIPPSTVATAAVTLTLNQSVFTCADLAKTMVTLTATDAGGNTATCTASIKVVDTHAPVYQNLPPLPLPTLTVECGDPLPVGAVFIAIDNCADTIEVLPVDVPVSNSNICGVQATKSFIRTWSVTDNNTPPVTITQDIIIKDTKAPVWQPAAPTMQMASTLPVGTVCSATVSLQAVASWVIDACTAFPNMNFQNTVVGPGMTYNVGCGPTNACASGTYNVGTHTVTFTATDPCGNSSTHAVTVVVKDATPPTAVCINGISIALNLNGQVIVTPNLVNNNSFDNCVFPLSFQVQELVSVNGDTIGDPAAQLVFNCDQADNDTQYPIILIVTDAGGNHSICETNVVVQDNVTPTITCPPNRTVECGTNLDPFQNPLLGIAGAVDNCPSNVDTTYSDVPVNIVAHLCPGVVRTWKAEDLAGNISTCTQLIQVVDTKAPKFNTPLPQNDTITCFEDDIAPVVSAIDNCTPDALIDIDLVEVKTDSVGVCGKYDYKVIRTWTATDKCGNTTVHTQVLTVQDTLAPHFFLPPNKTINQMSANALPTTNCTVPIVYNLGAQGVFNECAPLVECTVNYINFEPPLVNPITPNVLDISGNYPVGTTKVIFSVTDPCGNEGIDTLTINIVDNSLPIAKCIDNLIVSLGSNGQVSIDADDINQNSNDNCGIDTMFLSTTDFDCGDLGINRDTLRVIDIYGNMNFCVVNVQVTLGSTLGFNLAATGSTETFFGANNGSATAVAGGGSGSFTYAWNTGATTAAINGLAAGTYTISVTDTSTGCISVDTAIVVAGPKITVNVGTVNGCQGQIISVPVTVNNFINVTGFSVGFQLDNAAAGTITGIANINPQLANVVTTATSATWLNPIQTGTVLPNGTLLFNLTIQLSNAAVGTTSNISAAAIPALIFLQNINNVSASSGMLNFNNGVAGINCAATADVTIAGDIMTWKAPGLPVPGVNVALTGTSTGVDLTALPLADYSFLVNSGSNTTVTPTKVATSKNSRINVGDLLFIQAHAAPPPVQIPFTSPYQWLAGDINGDKVVNIIDYALVQAYIVNNPPSSGQFNFSPAPPDWKFVPKSYMFPAGNPLNPAPPASISHNAIAAAFLDDDFIGVLMGDVNGDVMPTFTGNTGADFSQTLKFRINERSVQEDETVTVAFKASDFKNRQAYQMTIAFDQDKFQLEDIIPGVLPGLSEANFGTNFVNEGLLSAIWVGDKQISVADNEVLFSLKLKALDNVNALSNALRVSSEITEAMAVNIKGEEEGIDFEFVTSVGTNVLLESKSFELYQNQPNPFSTETTIGFRLPEASRAKLYIFGTDGRLVTTIIGDYPAGNNSINIRKDEFGAPGVYWYKLETLHHSDLKKMILIN